MPNWTSIEELQSPEEIVAIVEWLKDATPTETEYTSMSEPATAETMVWPYIMLYTNEVYGLIKVQRSWLSRGTYTDSIYVEQL